MDVVVAGKAVVMGVVEGITEFLPISSTGHLIATGQLIGFFPGAAGKEFAGLFEVVIQLGAILAVVGLYRVKLRALIAGLIAGEPGARSAALGLVVAFIPTAVVGLLANRFVEEHLFNTGVVAAMLALGGLAILVVERWHPQARHLDGQRLPLATAFGIGCWQCVAAVLPGTSRSAATILGAMLMGVERKAATDFSFLLAIPTMAAASGYKLLKHREVLAANHDLIGILAIGFVVSFIVAWVAVAWLLRYIATHTFAAFGWYRIGAAVALALLLVCGYVGLTD
jgi:undecaprenyl-diphosphatase